MSSPRVEVRPDAATLATTVASEVLARLADLQAAGRTPQVALTGGTIADAVHREVARLSEGSRVDWGRVGVWWGDERFVAPDDPERNAGQARAAFLDAVGVDPAQVHEMPSTDFAGDVAAGAASYATEVGEELPDGFDLVMLGVGPDGHVASLFPGHPALEVEDLLAVAVVESPKPPPERISLTFTALNRARSVWFLASGEAKAEAVARVLGDGVDERELPAAGVSGHEETIWFLDRQAASQL